MTAFWEQLTKSQRRMVVAGLAVFAAAALFQLALLPWWEARQRVTAAIAANERALAELAALGEEYAQFKQRSGEILRVVNQRLPGFSLFSHLERKAGEAGVRMNILSIHPLKGMPAGDYEEAVVEVRMEKLTMEELTDFLYRLESPGELIHVRRASIAKMKEHPEYMSALLQVFTYQPLTMGAERSK
ncbi:MAG: type II secretion system protein GspM [Syntrophaceae bacterium]|nr:type II secretion system protein GspM [Syntrophaceae bacterium]